MFKAFEGFTRPFPEQDPSQPPATLWAFCRHYTRGFEWPLLFMALLSAAIAIVEVTLLGFMGELVDLLASHEPESFWAIHGNTLLLMAAVVLLLLPILALLHSLLLHQSLLGNYPMSIRWLAHRYLLKQSMQFYHDEFAGRVATKVLQTALAVRETVMKLLDVLVYVAVYFCSMLIMIGRSDLILMLPILLWLCAYIAIQVVFVPRMKQVATEQADARSIMTGRIVDSYANITTVKLFSHGESEMRYAENSMRGFLVTVYRQMRLATAFSVSVDLINYLLLFGIAALSIGLWMNTAISVGVIAVAISIALRLQGMSKWIMWEIGSLFENLGTVVDGMQTLSKPIAIEDAPNAPPLCVNQGAIEFMQVGFRYAEQPRILDNFNLQIRAGEKVGLVGRSGSGKSTLVNLLLRLHELEEGQIQIDGQSIGAVSQQSLRGNIGVVTQDTSLLHRSIRENILYGAPQASEAQLWAACQQAHADGFIPQLQDNEGQSGLDAQVGERGIKLSGGQRQRIGIARVLLKDAPILILDEATSALDSEVEAAIQASLQELMQGKTVIAIAHRLSTIAAMDRLVVMDKGRIVEQGTHQQLLAHNGIYAQLWRHQTGGFLGEAESHG